MMLQSNTVAVIDIGSNTTKLLVATKDTRIMPVAQQTEEVRLSEGIGKGRFSISPETTEKAIAAVHELITAANVHSPKTFKIVGTSALREAENSKAFIDALKQSTGLPVKILSGHDEALAIAEGAACDPEVAKLRSYSVVDIGGGSVECVIIKNKLLEEAMSFPLGSVRLTEKFVENPNTLIPMDDMEDINKHIQETLNKSPIRFSKESPIVFMGGSVNTTKRILMNRQLHQGDGPISVQTLRDFLVELITYNLEERRRIRDMPANRADIIPAAVMTMITLAEMAGQTHIVPSTYNLRFGVASRTLA